MLYKAERMDYRVYKFIIRPRRKTKNPERFVKGLIGGKAASVTPYRFLPGVVSSRKLLKTGSENREISVLR